MNTQADKTQENKSQSVANTSYQKQSSGKSTFQFVDNRPEAILQRKLQETTNNSPQVKQMRVIQRMMNNSIVVQLNGEWTKFQKAVDSGTITIEISAKQIKGNPKEKRMVRSGGRRSATGPVSNQSQERVLKNTIAAVRNGTARFISSTDTDFTIEVDSEHGKHGARQFNIHKGGGGENTRYIHQIYVDNSKFDTPEDAEYSDSESESDDDMRK